MVQGELKARGLKHRSKKTWGIKPQNAAFRLI